MFVLFGWGFKTKKIYGTNDGRSCPVCGNNGTQFIRMMSWFTLFFIPIFPYYVEHFEICPHCQNGIKISKQEMLDRLNSAPQQPPLQEDPFVTVDESGYSKPSFSCEQPSPDIQQQYDS